MGSTGVLLTNKKKAKTTSKYKVLPTVRAQRSFEDKSYYSAFREEDSEGHLGVTLNKELLQVAGETLRSNITILGSDILHGPRSSVMQPRSFGEDCSTSLVKLPADVGEIRKGLKLGDGDMEAALTTLHRFGNQSSSSLWYELAFMESQGRVKKTPSGPAWMRPMVRLHTLLPS